MGLTWPVLADVRAYLDRERLPIRRIVRATLAPEPTGSGVKSGAHCLALAQTLALRIHTRTPQEHPGTLHLFLSAPNVFPFYLGQLARGLGRIQMYEFAHGAGVTGAYTPSILLPPGVGRGESPTWSGSERRPPSSPLPSLPRPSFPSLPLPPGKRPS